MYYHIGRNMFDIIEDFMDLMFHGTGVGDKMDKLLDVIQLFVYNN